MLILVLILAAVALVREDEASLELRAETLTGSTTLRFQSRPGVWSTNADHLAKVALGHLVMSRSWIILQVEPRGQLRPMQWRTAQSQMAGLASLMEGIMSAPV